jgi:hypothetical protein
MSNKIITSFDNKVNNIAGTIFAFFLSKYNQVALKVLGYNSFSEAFSSLSKITGSKPNYIKLRRDEFDAFFPNGPRQGWNKRSATPIVSKFFDEFNVISYDDFVSKVIQLKIMLSMKPPRLDDEIASEIQGIGEIEIESIINFKDQNAGFKIVSRQIRERVVDYTIIDKLKVFYNYRCQICGARHFETYSVNISEGHHIEPFVNSLNNNASNIIILCPNHHRLMHIAKPCFHREEKVFTYSNGYVDKITINDHL